MTRILSYVRPAMTFAVVSITVSVFLTSCLKNHNEGVQTPVAAVMAFNLAPDKSSVGFSFSGNSLTRSPLGFGNYTGDYLNLYPGDRTVNTFDFYSSVSYADTAGKFAADKYYSLFFIGVNNKYRNVLVRDNYDSLTAVTGKAIVRYINAISDSLNPLSITLSSGATVVSLDNAGFGVVSPFTEVSSGNLSIAIKNNNGIDTARTITLDEKKVYTILLSGLQGSSSTPVEIKYISNGTLKESPANNTGISSGRGAIN